MKFIKNHIHIGIEKPFSVLHASDTHITFSDDRDGERKVKLSEHRIQCFPRSFENLQYIKNMAVNDRKTIIYTGDLIDFVSELNLDRQR